MSNVILVTSSKNEIGKSVIALKAAVEFSENNVNTILIDISNDKRSIARYTEVEEQIIYDVQDVIEETCSLEQATIEIKNSLHILPAPRLKEKLNIVEEKQFNKLISELRIKYECVIIDGPVIFNQNFIDYKSVDCVLIIDNSDISSIRNTYKIYNLFNRNIKKKTYIIINKYKKENVKHGIEFSYKDMKNMLPGEVLGYINYDEVFIDLEPDFFFEYKIKEFNDVVQKLVRKVV